MSKPSIEETLAENLRACASYRKVTTKTLAATSGLGNGTVGRLLLGQASGTIASIAALADALGLQPWQLLTPGLDPENPPALRSITEAERDLYMRIEGLFERLKEAESTQKQRKATQK